MKSPRSITGYPKALVGFLRYRLVSWNKQFLFWFVRTLQPNMTVSILHNLERVGVPPVLRMVPMSWRYREVVKNRFLLTQSCSVRLPEVGLLVSEEYSWPNRYLWELHNVTLDVTSGHIFGRDHVLDLSSNRHRSVRDSAFISGSARRAQAELEAVHYSGEISSLGDTLHHYHFWVETLPRVLYVTKHFPNVKFLTSVSVSQYAQVVLKAFQIEYEVVSTATVATADLIIAIDHSPYFWPNPFEIEMLQEELESRGMVAFDKQLMKPSRLYISRSGSRRSALNEQEIELKLVEFGINPVALQDYSLADQLRIVNDSTEIIGLHGAGLTNMIFMARDGRVTEVTSGEEFEECYRRLAHVCGLDYELQVIPASLENRFGEAEEILNLLSQ